MADWLTGALFFVVGLVTGSWIIEWMNTRLLQSMRDLLEARLGLIDTMRKNIDAKDRLIKLLRNHDG